MTETEIEKYFESPDVCMWADEEQKNYNIEVQLPGVEKDTITLKMHEDSFFVKGETENTVYIGSYAVCCEVDPDKAKAEYKNGLLKISVPFKDLEFHTVDVKID